MRTLIVAAASALLLSACSSGAPKPTSPDQLRSKAGSLVASCEPAKAAQYGTTSAMCKTPEGDDVWLDTCGEDQQACTTTATIGNGSGMIYAVEGDGWVVQGFKRSVVDPVAAKLR